ncbi:MAG TPA: polysaccharide deacetylase family protein [Candidatus Eisenbacteria bacterium]|nr:polysaccharide deacetylase family protein [Candidatus Eisenbacteria bacterium]
MRLAFVTSRYPPESSPAAKRAAALTGALTGRGHHVTVLTQMPNYPDPAAYGAEKSRATEIMRDASGNVIWRFPPKVASKDDFVRRLAWEARFAYLASSTRKLHSNLDGVIASMPFVLNSLAARSFRIPMWLDLRDLTWEYARFVGRVPFQRLGVGALRAVALSAFRAAQGISTTSESQRRYLIENGVQASRVHFVPNGVSGELLQELERRSAASSSNADGRRVRLVYAGLLGYIQGIGFAADAVANGGSGDVELHVYGDGVERSVLAERSLAPGYSSVKVHGFVPYEGYIEAITSADILLVTLRPEAESAMPSKILEYMGAGKPILFAGKGEGADAIHKAGSGLVVPYGDTARFQECLADLVRDPAARRQMGENGRAWVQRHRVREQVNAEWVDAIENAIEGRLASGGAMKRSRTLAATAVRGAGRAGFIRILERTLGGRPDRLAVLTYHRIAEPHARPRFAPGTLSATPAEFAEHVEFLARQCRVLGLEELLALLRRDRTLPPRAVLLTFDDAYVDFEEHAWPALKRAGLPVTLFVPTGYPDRPERSFWWDRLFQAIARSTATRVSTPVGAFEWSSFQDRVRCFRALRESVKEMPHEDAMDLVRQICSDLGKDHPTPAILGWSALRALAREGVSMGSHTRTHPMMDRIPIQDAREEIRGSIEDLERELGAAAPVFAYPAGRHNARLSRLLEESGVQLAFTTVPGVNDARRSDRLALRRVHVGARTGLAGLRAQILGLRPAT